MKILLTGASGLVGTELIPAMEGKGWEVVKLSRSATTAADTIRWDAYDGFDEADLSRLEGFDAVVHLAGESVVGTWAEEKKRRIMDSRVNGTRSLVNAFRKLQDPPKTFVSASAVGYYGDRGDEVLTEGSSKGSGFLPDVGEVWENEAQRAAEFAQRVVMLRIGVVLSDKGGALAKMLLPFKFGVGGTVGSGKQWMSWIAIEDLVNVILFSLTNEKLAGPVNAVAPNPVDNQAFTETLGKVLHRPTILPVPSFGIKLLFGEMGQNLLLEGCRVLPDKLDKAGFEFAYPDLEKALRHILKT